MELTVDEALKKGIEAHKAGKAQEADRIYTAILKAQPRHPDANYNMGVLAVGLGKVQESLPFFKNAIEENLDSKQYWLSYIGALIKLDLFSEAVAVIEQAKMRGVDDSILNKAIFAKNTPQDRLNFLFGLYGKGKIQETIYYANSFLQSFPSSPLLYNIIGIANQGLGRLAHAEISYQKALSIKPDYDDAYNNLGVCLQGQERLGDALDAYNKAISINPDYAEAHNNKGNVYQEQGKFEDAVEAYSKAISIKPDYADAFNNLGNALSDQGKPVDAIEAYKNAISIKPYYPEAYNNMGIALKNLGKLKKAVEVFNKAISINPSYGEAHRNISLIKKYKSSSPHFNTVKILFKDSEISDDTRCQLSFTLAKMYEDLEDFGTAFEYLSVGNDLRKRLLNYSIDQDIKLFEQLKKTQPKFQADSRKVKTKSNEISPIFIIGMPRSGTTLVEQIISSHPSVTGAGELRYASLYGASMVTGDAIPCNINISKFKKSYLFELAKLSNNKHLVTDKMPQNFRLLPLICAAFPKAKIVHVQRDPKATCWSNYRHYFGSKSIGFCYNLDDLVVYYLLYRNLMRSWQPFYGNRIYNLNYEKLTTDQESQTKNLLAYLNIKWDEACLSPQENNRIVRTASQQQVRRKIYKGSSKNWEKYEGFIDGAFDRLKSI